MEQSLCKDKNNLNTLIELLTYGFLIFLYLRLFIPGNDLAMNAIFGLWGAFIFLLNVISTKKFKLLELLILSCLFIGILINVFFIKNASIYEPLWIICYFGIYLTLNNNLLKPKGILAITLIFYFIMIAWSFTNTNTNEIFYGSSKNAISAVGIFLLSLYYISAYLCKEKIFKFPVFLLFYCCMWAGGRTGFLISTLWIVGLIFINLSENKFQFDLKLFKFLVITFLSIIALLTIKKAYYLSSINEDITVRNIISVFDLSKFNSIDTFKSKGIKSPRLVFWSNYLAFIISSPKAFIFGASRINNPELYPYAENLHNVFFMLHSKTGLLGFIPVVVLLIRAFINLIREKNVTILFVLCMFGLRSMFDWIGFFSYYDVLFYFVLFTYNKDLFGNKDAFNFSQKIN
jgi:hypothetical protein